MLGGTYEGDSATLIGRMMAGRRDLQLNMGSKRQCGIGISHVHKVLPM